MANDSAQKATTTAAASVETPHYPYQNTSLGRPSISCSEAEVKQGKPLRISIKIKPQA